jgi:hypothetical protein
VPLSARRRVPAAAVGRDHAMNAPAWENPPGSGSAAGIEQPCPAAQTVSCTSRADGSTHRLDSFREHIREHGLSTVTDISCDVV